GRRLVPCPSRPVNRFFRSALFPLIIIAALVWLALNTLSSHGAKVEKQTTSWVYQQIQNDPASIQDISIDPNKQSLTLTDQQSKKYSVHYASPESEAALEKLMLSKGVNFNSKGVGSSPWWSILTSLLPFVLLFGFWIFLMNQVQGGGSKVMSFGKSRAKRMTPDSPKIGFKDVAGVDEAVEELQEIKEFLENPKKFQALGARIPKGVLLYGPPGTGKTLPAPAAARSSRCTRRASRWRRRSISTRWPPVRPDSPAPISRTSSTRPRCSQRAVARRRSSRRSSRRGSCA